ncbi:DUF4832 domain-containing protein [Pengzhenrongella frigida]|uniref:DUF4832 domain-containing protein n=1 Tax=Pengzhenrongella frigida TaxID=1259133 RepID=A0A4Q5MW02_9MICO|nr:DUF4832 domain-containing protein [Cellulomonas sp. HLT2-17]
MTMSLAVLLGAGALMSAPIATAATATAATVAHTYAASSAALANPDRGFYHYSETHFRADGSGYTPLDAAQLTSWRTSEKVTLVYRIFYLEKFADQDTIDDAILRLVAADLATARAAGVKLVVRFAYSDSSSADASAARVVGHIRQLAPVLNASADVVSVLQAGFVGQWGEWYYSDNFASDPAQPWLLSDADWAARGAVLNALLSSTDARIPVLVRYPAIKQRLVAATSAQAARVGIHDDCFGAGTDDYGTFATATDRQWLADQSRTVPVGGESCEVNEPRTQWPSASADLAAYHWSFLNADYHADVLSSWGDAGRAEAGRRLGYRLRLTSSTLPTGGVVGGNLSLQLSLTNDGYAAPFRDRPVQVVLRSATTTYKVTVPIDLRTLTPGATSTFTVQVPVPATPGDYATFLALPDPAATLASMPAYAIQLANTGTWQATEGWNSLQHTFTVAAATTATPAAVAVALGSLTATSVTNGWGPRELNRSNGEAVAGDGRPLTIRGRQYARGIGVHAASAQTFALGAKYAALRTTIGVDDETGGLGSVVFKVYVDGKLTYTSPQLTGTSAPLPILVKLTGAKSVRLVVTDGGNGIAYDHADWAEPLLDLVP